ncbi:uncharacterized protein LOC114165449 [Vigna unguiculata]|uniref:uncharacterized protein LOC114165449 n=1 Tax=Vigna unguiculata TaxID=3917 RepID=UPI00101703A7|nr:uncharacterized protein LOC114165449 [Vigna unguiculata]
MSIIQKHTHSLQELNPEKESWNIVARVGVLIHASVRRTLIYKFQYEIKEDKVYTIQSFSVSCNGGSYRTTNHAYKINFQFETKVNMVESTLVSKTRTSYTPFSTIIAASFDTDYLVNVIGMFTGVGTERELEKAGKKTKINVIYIEADGMWDSTESPSQPLTQLCASSKVSLKDDFIKLHPRSSIEGLKDFKQESTFVVKATIKHVLDHDDWWYKLKLRVIDATDSTTFVVFDRDAGAMLKKSCSDILDLQYKDLYSANEEESKVNERTNQISSDSIVEDLLIKFTEESNDVETLSDHLNNIVSSHVPAKESLKNKDVIDVEIDELTRKESSHLDNLDLATQPLVPALKRQSRSMVQENKKIPVKMLKKNIKIEK